jgi:putative autoinducer-2 (AI-2) aldolase
MDWGLQNRIAQIIKPTDNRALMLAVDHGYFLGPTEKLEVPRKAISPLLKHCDSLMLTRGVQRTSVSPKFPTPIVLRVSGGSSIIGADLSNEEITVSIKDAIRLNACALAMSIFVGSKYEKQTIVNLGKLVSEAEEFGIPVLAVTAVGKEIGQKDARYLSLACRIAAEQGAHIVKTYYCKNFEKVVESCPVPIIIAGGKKIPERDALELAYNSIKSGAVGVDMGRNIWQSDNPVPMIRAVRSIVHGNSNVNDAFTLYQKLCKEKPVKNSLAKQKIKNSQPKKQNNFQPKKQNNFQPKKQNNFQPKKQNNSQPKKQNNSQPKKQN